MRQAKKRPAEPYKHCKQSSTIQNTPFGSVQETVLLRLVRPAADIHLQVKATPQQASATLTHML
jgi:hypothetical protein